jgi:hypothetical protein
MIQKSLNEQGAQQQEEDGEKGDKDLKKVFRWIVRLQFQFIC